MQVTPLSLEQLAGTMSARQMWTAWSTACASQTGNKHTNLYTYVWQALNSACSTVNHCKGTL